MLAIWGSMEFHSFQLRGYSSLANYWKFLQERGDSWIAEKNRKQFSNRRNEIYADLESRQGDWLGNSDYWAPEEGIPMTTRYMPGKSYTLSS